jgi:hypothetical protein
MMRSESVFLALAVGCSSLSVIHVGCGGDGKARSVASEPDSGLEAAAPAPSIDPGLDAGSFFGDGGNPYGDGSGRNVDACASTSKTAELVALDIMLALDTSASMDFYQKWVSVQAAINDAFGASADGGPNNTAFVGMGVGVQYFPLFPKECSVDDYADAAVGISLLPAVSPLLTNSLGLRRMYGGTPTTQVMLGVTQYMHTWATTLVNGAPRYLSRKPIIILATDGVPDDACLGSTPANNIANAVAATAAAAAGTPPIQTFVIGVGANLGGLSALQAIASAGGTGQAFIPVDVNTAANVETQFVQALTKIRTQAIPCDYTIPDLGGPIDATKVNVGYTAGAGQSQDLFVFVGSSTMCGLAADHGWYFDDPMAPTKVSLCPQACSTVKASQTGRVDVIYGCQTVAVTM